MVFKRVVIKDGPAGIEPATKRITSQFLFGYEIIVFRRVKSYGKIGIQL
jgi:hypothetical protein